MALVRVAVAGTSYNLSNTRIGEKFVEITEEQAVYLRGISWFEFEFSDSSEGVDNQDSAEGKEDTNEDLPPQSPKDKPLSKWTTAECVAFMEANSLTIAIDEPKVADLRKVIKEHFDSAGTSEGE